MVFLDLVSAVLVRLVFVSYCFIATWRVVVTYNNIHYWILTGLLFGLLLETIMTLVKRKGREWAYFSPSIFFFLVPAVPCIWLMELQLMDIRVNEASRLRNTTEARIDDYLGVSISIPLDEFGWVLALEQSLLFILIIGRWILPKGDISRNQLSQLLLVHVGMAADIMEIFELFKEERFIDSEHLIYPALSLWTLSLLQYCLVISAIKGRKTRFSDLDESNDDDQRINVQCCRSSGDINVDIVGIISSILMQDLPFLIFRLYLLIALGVISHMMIFFTCKNALVVVLQLYRFVAICKDSDSDDVSEIDIPSPQNGFTQTST